jgi:hypothetical protein
VLPDLLRVLLLDQLLVLVLDQLLVLLPLLALLLA